MPRLSISIKDANSNGKWGHLSKASLFPWIFVAASNKKIALEPKPCLIYHGTIQLYNLYTHGQTQQFFFSPSSSHSKTLSSTKDMLDWKTLHYMREWGESQTEKITGSCFDLVQQYCRDAQVIKVQTDRATTGGKAKWDRGARAPAHQGETI